MDIMKDNHPNDEVKSLTTATTTTTTTTATTASTSVVVVSDTKNDVNSSISSSQQQVQVKIGQTRIRDAKHLYSFGTIEYDGMVDGHVGRYYGIVWDDPHRGKHDGSIVNKKMPGNILQRYFTTPPGQPTAGSLVRHHLIDLGCNLTKSVLLERYQNVQEDDEDADSHDDGGSSNQKAQGDENDYDHDLHHDRDKQEVYTVSTVSGGSKPIEFVGRTKILKQQQWKKLAHMSLRCMGIRGILRDKSEFREVQHLVHLDFAANLFSDWSSLFDILETFPNLQRLSMAKNRMIDDTLLLQRDMRPDEKTTTATSCCNDVTAVADAVAHPHHPIPTTKQYYPNMTHLNLRDCHIETFVTVHTLLRHFPNLQELCIAYSKLSDIVESSVVVTTADADAAVDDNADKDRTNETTKLTPRDVGRRIAAFNNLRSLDVTQCGFETPEQVEALSYMFPKLQCVVLNHNPLVGWPSFHANGSCDGDGDNDSDVCTTGCWSTSLQELHLDHTCISYWKSIRPILCLQNLRSLRFSSASSFQTTTSSITPSSSSSSSSTPYNNSNNNANSSNNNAASVLRMHFIAALPQLQQYQSSTIADRKEMEQQFVLSAVRKQRAVDAEQKVQQPKQQRADDDKIATEDFGGLLSPQDERYQELLKTYSDLVERTKNQRNGHSGGGGGGGGDDNTMFLSMVTVTIQSYCPSSCTMPPVVRNLPLRLTIARLKAFIARHLDLDTDLQHLQWKFLDDKHSFPMDFPNDDDEEITTLQDCGIADGIEILVKERDLTPPAASKEPKSSSRGRQQVRDTAENRHEAFLERIRQQEAERYDLDKRKAAAAAGGSRSTVHSLVPIVPSAAPTTVVVPTSAEARNTIQNKDGNSQ